MRSPATKNAKTPTIGIAWAGNAPLSARGKRHGPEEEKLVADLQEQDRSGPQRGAESPEARQPECERHRAGGDSEVHGVLWRKPRETAKRLRRQKRTGPDGPADQGVGPVHGLQPGITDRAPGLISVGRIRHGRLTPPSVLQANRCSTEDVMGKVRGSKRPRWTG